MTTAEHAISPRDHVLHSSMQLFVLAESRPRPGIENWVEIACVRRGNTDHILCYPSPVDARIEQHSYRRGGKNYQVVPLESLDPTAFIESHEGRLNFCLVYGFCAHNGRLLVEQADGLSLMATGAWKGFSVPAEARSHFKLEFGSMHEMLGHIFAVAGLPLQANTLQDLASYGSVELDRIAEDAPSRASRGTYRSPCNEFAVYDPIELRWRFGPTSRIRTHNIH